MICGLLNGSYGNPSSSHIPGIEARKAIENAREQTAALIGASSPGEVYFTSGGTESNNIAISGAAALAGRGHIISTVIEHPAVLNPLKALKDAGFFEITLVPVDGNGIASVREIEKAMRKDTALITVMHANNETGTIEPVEEIGALARQRGILFHTDAAQSVGKIAVDVRKMNVDMLSIAGHKFHAPKGIGALYVREGVKIKNTIMYGAGHERGMRPGTENTPYIAGLGKACELAGKAFLSGSPEAVSRLGELLFSLLKKEMPDIAVNCEGAGRLPNTLSLRIPGIDGPALVSALKESVAISAGSACHEGTKSPSGVLKAIGLSDEEAFSTVRISLGRYTTEEEIREAAGHLQRACLQLAQARSGRGFCL